MAVMEVALPSRGLTASPALASYCFGKFRLCLATRQLWRDDAQVALSSRALDLLAAFLRAPGVVLSRDELMRQVWGTVSVLDSNLTVHLCLLRRALGSDRGLIATVPGRGYQFIGAVTSSEGTAAPAGNNPNRISLWVPQFRPLGACARFAAFGRAVPKAVHVALARNVGIRLVSAEIAESCENRADWRLEGCYQATDERVRVTVELVRTSDGSICWADCRDFAAADRFALHDEVSSWLSKAVSQRMDALRT